MDWKQSQQRRSATALEQPQALEQAQPLEHAQDQALYQAQQQPLQQAQVRSRKRWRSLGKALYEPLELAQGQPRGQALDQPLEQALGHAQEQPLDQAQDQWLAQATRRFATAPAAGSSVSAPSAASSSNSSPSAAASKVKFNCKLNGAPLMRGLCAGCNCAGCGEPEHHCEMCCRQTWPGGKAFSSPERESQERATKKARVERQQRATIKRATKKARVERQQRATIMLDISRGLENVADVPNLFKALHLCIDSRLVFEEAKNTEFLIGRKVQKIRKTSTCAGATALATALMKKWSDEKAGFF